MNIIHLATNKVWGGGESYILTLARALRSDGHAVSVITRRYQAVASRFEAEGLHGGFTGPGGPFDVLSPVRLARRLEATEGPAVIHVHNFKDAATAVAARRLMNGDRSRVRVVVTRHLARTAPQRRSHLKLIDELDAIIFVSQKACDIYMSTLPPETPRDKFHVIHTGVVDIAPQAVPTRLDTLPIELLVAARIEPEKGIDTLLEALGIIGADGSWHLTVCGTGTSRNVMPLINLTKRLGIDKAVTWAGQVKSIDTYLEKTHVVVVPSRVPEALSMVIIEAMMHATTAISTDNGAQPELIKDGVSGLLVAPENPNALAAAIRKFIDTPRLVASMGAQARQIYTSDFGYGNFYHKITDIYNGR